MSNKKISLIICLSFLFLITENAITKDKLLYYESGALTKRKNVYKHAFRYMHHYKYRIEFGLINYSDGFLNIDYNQNQDNFKTLYLNSQEDVKEVFYLKPRRSREFLLNIKVNFDEINSDFVSYDIFIFKEE